MMYPLVLDLAAKNAPVRVPIAVTCRVLGFSKQAFDHWRKDPVTQRDWDDAQLIHAAIDVHTDDPEFGYRFIFDKLREHCHTASENRVGRLCSQQRIYSAFAKRKGVRNNPGRRSTTTGCSAGQHLVQLLLDDVVVWELDVEAAEQDRWLPNSVDLTAAGPAVGRPRSPSG